MAVNVDVKLSSDVAKKVEEAFAFLENKQFRKLMGQIGQILRTSAIDRFDNSSKKGPDGTPWPGYADSTIASRIGQSPPRIFKENLLTDTGQLKASIQSKVESDFSVLIGSDLNYAATHQFGDPSRNIPERPYLGVSTDDEQDIVEAIERFISKELGE